MATATFYLTRIISSRYFKENDIDLFFRAIRTLQTMQVKVHPTISVIRSSSQIKRTLDVLLDTGVRVMDIEGKINDSSIFIQSVYSKSYYRNILYNKTLDCSRIQMKPSEYTRFVFNEVAEFIVSNVDDTVELRCIR